MGFLSSLAFFAFVLGLIALVKAYNNTTQVEGITRDLLDLKAWIRTLEAKAFKGPVTPETPPPPGPEKEPVPTAPPPPPPPEPSVPPPATAPQPARVLTPENVGEASPEQSAAGYIAFAGLPLPEGPVPLRILLTAANIW